MQFYPSIETVSMTQTLIIQAAKEQPNCCIKAHVDIHITNSTTRIISKIHFEAKIHFNIENVITKCC